MSDRFQLRRWLAATAAAAALTGPALAASDAALRAEVQELREELSQLREQLKSLKQQSGAQFTETIRRQDEQPKVKLDNGRPSFESADGNFTAQIRGRVQFDGF